MQTKQTAEQAEPRAVDSQPLDPALTAIASDDERNARRAARGASRDERRERPGVMIPSRLKRLPIEGPLMRVVATAGIVGIAVVVAAIMASQHSAGWLIGLVASIVTVMLAATLWSSRRL